MKKFLLLALMSLSTATVMAQQSPHPLVINSAGDFEVYDEEQLRYVIKNFDGRPGIMIRLKADIQITDPSTISHMFRGTITGKHKEYSKELNDSVDAMYCIDGGRGNGLKVDGLFNELYGAKFEYIRFKNFRLEKAHGGARGIFATHTYDAVFSNLVFDNISVWCDDRIAGLIACFGLTSKFENILITSCDVSVDGREAGCLVGWSENSSFKNCFVSVTSGVYANGSLGDAVAGGLVGTSRWDEFEYCVNSGLVCGQSDEIGGIAGRSDHSKFTGCENNFAVLYAHEEGDDNKHFYFKNILNQVREKTNSLTPEEKASMGYQVPASLISSLSSITGVTISHGLIYDEVGGICGYAVDSDFESCTNNAIFFCDSSKYGGIVGSAEGGTINNCLNTGVPLYTEVNSLGGIVGAVSNQPKITNCISTQDAPIIGEASLYSSASDVSEDSGNNYRLKNDSKSNRFRCYEMQVESEKIADGTVAIWLNNGIENHNLAVKPWRQNLTAVNRDYNPVLDKSHNEVLPKNLINHRSISNEEDLREFAESVNSGDCFCNGVLENDIEITSGDPWTPIGTKDQRWRGVFDGQGYTISGLKCSVADGSEEGAGLFGTIDVHADIRNVILDETCEIEHRSSQHANAYGAGGIVGTVRNNRRGWGSIHISGCGNYGNVTTSHHAGGILGRVISDNNDGDGSHVKVVVDSCFNSGIIRADGNSALICGYMDKYGVVTNCWSDGALWHRRVPGRAFAMNSPSDNPEAEYFAGYGGTITVSNCCDYRSNVDWGGLAEEKRCQKGVERIVNDAAVASDEAPFAPRLCDECAASINDAASDAESSGDAYDIMGHKVGCNHHGIIIVNGKKVLNNH